MKYRIPLIVGLMTVLLSGCGSTGQGGYYYDSYDDNNYSRYEVDKSDLNDDINGTYTVEACSSSGCYDVEADISDGELDTIYFDNGGYIDDPGGEGWEISDFPDDAYEDAYEDNYDTDEYYYDGY